MLVWGVGMAAFLATVGRRDHHRILAWIDEAKRPDTRTRRMEEAIALLLRDRIPHRP
ncbi:YdeI/OmpD-associated family protein [Actinoplanes sp. NBC_00393]|uniref:YdeI/OmpD-associated family protein n=1 Tax=Actinoplanes sp. NBC_00393 TaxID=2975953 RepID=UPI002E1C02A7